MDREEWSGILVYVEYHNQKIHPVSLELIGEAKKLTEESKEKIYVAAVGCQVKEISEQLMGYPVDKAFLYEIKDEFQADIYEKAIEDCINKVKPSIVLIGGTIEGRTIAPRLAVEYRSGLTADCTKLDVDEAGHLIQTRPAFGGNIMASIITETARPQFATVRQGIYEKPARWNAAEVPIEIIDFSVTGRKIKLLGTEKIIDKNNLTDQKVLVVAGNGVKRKEDLEMLRELADLLGGRLASSRALVEKGWMTPSEQIGLSGSAVCPKCMITCGISGSVQFMAGMKTTPNIIAINTDANAAIFGIAHYPICADLYEIIPELLNILKS